MGPRDNMILGILNERQRVEVSELAQAAGVSEVTMRKDLKALEERGIIQREHGFALLASRDDINGRLAYHYEEKLRIAHAALALVDEGSTVMIENGSCCALLAAAIVEARRDVRIITNSAFIANYVRAQQSAHVTLLGGDYQNDSQVNVGPMLRRCAEEFCVDLLFIGVDGWSAKLGFTNDDALRAEAIRDMARQAERVVVLTESEKFRRHGIVPLRIGEQVTRVVTDAAIAPEARSALEAAGVTVVTVGAARGDVHAAEGPACAGEGATSAATAEHAAGEEGRMAGSIACTTDDAAFVARAAASPAESAATPKAALFFDIDGTLIPNNKAPEIGEAAAEEPAPSQATYEAFRRLRANGHAPFICTGRPYNLLTDDLLRMDLAGIVCGSGACVYLGGELVSEDYIAEDVLAQAVELAVRDEIEFVFEGRELSVSISKPGTTYVGIRGVATAHSLAEMHSLAPSLHFQKIVFNRAYYEVVMANASFFLAHFTLCDLANGVFEMSPIGMDKGAGIRRAVELLGGGPWRTYGFGDSENDLPMLRAVDVPVAMGNAMDSVKAEAAYVTDDAEDDGVVTALAHFGLT